MKYSKKGLRLSARCAVIAVICFALFSITQWVCYGITSDLDALNAGERWAAAGEAYASIVLHTDRSAVLYEYEVENYISAIDSALEEAAVESSERGNAFACSYYGETTVQVTGPKSSSTANVMYVGGNFFTFHPLEFLYGSPFAHDPTLPDGVVLDDELAWRLFGTLNVVGMDITWNDRTLTVTGIVTGERDSDAYVNAYGDIPRMYMSSYGYQAGTYSECTFTTFETVIPNPVDGFADGIFRTAVNSNEDTTIIKENSSRYTFLNRCRIIPTLQFRGMRTDQIIYPYFENELQVVDFQVALLTLGGLVCGGVGVLLLVLSLISLFLSDFSLTAIIKRGVKTTVKSIRKTKNQMNQKTKGKGRRII